MAEDLQVAADRYLKGAEKFDYFMAGAAGALCAYVAQHYVPTRLGLNPSTLELASLLTLVAAAIAAVKRIEGHNVLAGLAYQLAIFGTIVDGKASAPNITPASAIVQTAKGGEMQKRAGRRAELYYAWRNRLLLVGFLELVGARVWIPYFTSA